VARALAPAHIIAVASPGYMAGRVPPFDPGGLKGLDSIVMRLKQSGRIRLWTMHDAAACTSSRKEPRKKWLHIAVAA
jgi:hypothetical protein